MRSIDKLEELCIVRTVVIQTPEWWIRVQPMTGLPFVVDASAQNAAGGSHAVDE